MNASAFDMETGAGLPFFMAPIYPSAVSAHLSMTYGRPFSCIVKNLRFSHRHSSSITPTVTSTPASRNFRMPRPSTLANESRQPTTTRGMPFSIMRSAQGGVRP